MSKRIDGAGGRTLRFNSGRAYIQASPAGPLRPGCVVLAICEDPHYAQIVVEQEDIEALIEWLKSSLESKCSPTNLTTYEERYRRLCCEFQQAKASWDKQVAMSKGGS